MRIAREGNLIYMAEMNKSMVVANFNDELTEKAKSHFINDHNTGIKILDYVKSMDLSCEKSCISFSDAENLLDFLNMAIHEYNKESIMMNRRKE